MPRQKSNVEKKRKNFDIPVKHLEMLEEIRQSIKAETESETLRYVIAQTYYLQKALDEGNQLLIRDQQGATRGVIFF